MAIIIKQGDIFESNCEVLVCPVNCVGVMGAGLAKEFKVRYPEMFNWYKRLCNKKMMRLGRVQFYLRDNPTILFFPTKDDWRNASEIYYIKSGINDFISQIDSRADSPWVPKSIAFPALGCGLGGLRWELVKDVMCRKLFCLDIDIEIYEPKEG